MHPNPIFHDAETAQNLGFARDRGFGVLAVSSDAAPLISHVPFLLSESGEWADLHLVRSNPIVRALKETKPARIAVGGPDGYVSPDWYGVPDQVPTWNYVAVHLTGELELRPDSELLDLLDRQSAFFEARLGPKPPWTTSKMNPEALARMMRMIVPARLRITGVDGTWKLSQNKTEAARAGAAEAISGGVGSELNELARLMRAARVAAEG
ncbi:negative transcriptional regulator [Leisingera sp. ANG-M1]|uniref:FMN-binding negative transcriptional regulator n=1 Tax=Leisingera sp. ANG-M1 TaxID=1577895 RepID=UPI00057C49E8|nr:FMN-binding negative transcriptional regulator [Leisingera sp. ANG-M1]KIC09368.1 negative transcriptional regulator [Leisingera sp. ANG-M1]